MKQTQHRGAGPEKCCKSHRGRELLLSISQSLRLWNLAAMMPERKWRHFATGSARHIGRFLGSRVKRSESIKWPSGVCPSVRQSDSPTVRPSDRPSRNLNMDNISDTNNTRATKLWPKLVCGKTFQRPFQDLSKHIFRDDLESRSRSQGDLENLEKLTFAYFSDTNYSRIMEPLPYCGKWQDLYSDI